MSIKKWRYILFPILLVFVGFGALSSIISQQTPSVQQSFSEKINLALRQTAHKLLLQSGDSTSTILPVKKTAPNTYMVVLERHFNYDSLSVILQNSLKTFNIEGTYNVAVWDCKNEELVLGYSSLDLLKELGVACVGRNQALDCYNFTITFDETVTKSANSSMTGFFLGGLFVLSMGTLVYLLYNKPAKKEIKKEIMSPIINSVALDTTHLIHIGDTVFDTRNQTVSIAHTLQKLTFREAKLLELFCHHQNELLDRDHILKAVWEDEGVLVSRSVDVFVSRLRKVLKNDVTLKITNVHSRGYRFETLNSAS